MSVAVEMTRLAESRRKRLRGQVERAYKDWLSSLTRDGCAAMDYRLTGPLVEQLCVRHVRDNWRAVVAFRSDTHAVIVGLGQHLDRSPQLDVYAQLYRMAGIAPPQGQRTKPSCCDGAGWPPEWDEVCDDIVEHARQISRRR